MAYYKFYPILRFILILLVFNSLLSCKKKTNTSTNLDFAGKSLPFVQSYVTGKWRLNYTIGGISVAKTQANNGQYIIISSNRFIQGSNGGQTLDSSLVWKRIPTNSGRGDSTYLLYFGVPNGLVINQIKSDTLILSDYLIADGYGYFYTKF